MGKHRRPAESEEQGYLGWGHVQTRGIKDMPQILDRRLEKLTLVIAHSQSVLFQFIKDSV